MNDFAGSFAGPGPLIGNVPTSREQSFVEAGTGLFEFEQDVDLYSLSLGGGLHWNVGADDFTVDLSGWSLGLGAIYRF